MRFKAVDLRTGKAVTPDILIQEEHGIVAKTFVDELGNCHDCSDKRIDLKFLIGIKDKNGVEVALGDDVGVRDVCIRGNKYGDLIGVVSLKAGRVVLEAEKDYPITDWIVDDQFVVEFYVL